MQPSQVVICLICTSRELWVASVAALIVMLMQGEFAASLLPRALLQLVSHTTIWCLWNVKPMSHVKPQYQSLASGSINIM